MPTTRVLFAGFPPAKRGAKQAQLRELLRQARAGLPATLVLYESPHRILSTLETLAELLDEDGSLPERRVVLCRELTKRYETLLFGNAREVLAQVESDPEQQRGEFVLLVEGGKKADAATVPAGTMPAAEVVRLLSAELPASKAAYLAAKICGGSKKELKRELFEEAAGR